MISLADAWMMVTGVLVKERSDHTKTAEFPMKACWKEDAQAVTSKPQEETVTYEELKVKY